MSPGVATPCPAAPPTPIVKVCFINVLLAGIPARDITFEFLNDLGLAAHNPLHQIADRNHADHGSIVHDGEMAKVMVGHDGHTLVHRVLPGDEYDRIGDDLLEGRVLWRGAPQD